MSAGAPGAVGAETQEPRAGRFDHLFSANPAKRATERIWLWYTPVWGIAAAVVMMGGLANQWRDLGLTIFCVVVGAAALVLPIVLRSTEERARPWWRSTAFKLGFSVTLFAILINYQHNWFFFDVLHMHYGFNTTLNVRQTPIGLYIITIAYFATYSVLCLMTFRGVRSAVAGSPKWVQYPAIATAPFAVAFLETALNANPFMTHLFCYDSPTLALSFGTVAYGTAFCFALPVWLAIDERPGKSAALLPIAMWVLAAVYAQDLVLQGLRYSVAPYLTTVEDDAQGFRDFDESCLEPLPE